MATPESRRPFEEAADSDSDVSSDTTVQSDSEAEYSVEKVCPLSCRSLHITILNHIRFLQTEWIKKENPNTW